MLQLPDFNSLSEEQDDILDLPLDASTLITGPPGTGKTIMAIYRAQMLDKARKPTLLLMYGKLLSTYTKAAVKKSGIDGIVSTYHSWFPRFYQDTYGGKPPMADRWTFDWSEIKQTIVKSPIPEQQQRHIIVDEGQDMPQDFYLVLRLISRSMTILADENQRITSDQSTLAEIQAATGIRDVHTLTRNYRNTRPIAEFAARFYTGLPSGVPELPGKKATGDRPALYHHKNLYASVQQILNYEATYGDRSIGVLLPYASQVKSLYNRLDGKTKRPVQGYLGGENGKALAPLDFSKSGVKLVTWASAKGLEFDTVFLPELQSVKSDPAGDDLRMRMYVLTSRAKKQLFLQYSGEGVPPFVDSLPLQLLDDRR